jgi:hypothetical protein
LSASAFRFWASSFDVDWLREHTRVAATATIPGAFENMVRKL